MRKATISFAAYALCVLAAGAGTLKALIALSIGDPTASHLVLIPFVSVALIWHNRTSIFDSVRMDASAGVAVISIGAALAAAGWTASGSGASDSLSVAVAALVVLWLGGFVLFYGRRAARSAMFPLLFLGFMTPIPSGVLHAVTSYLKWGSSNVVGMLFTMTGTPYHQDGFVFSLPTFVIEIADECSGIRSSISLLLTSLLTGHLLLEKLWTKAVLVATVVPLAIIKNGIRIVSLSLLAMHIDPGFLAGSLHHEGGIVFYLLALTFLAPILGILRRSELSRLARIAAGA
jgi:exosortase